MQAIWNNAVLTEAEQAELSGFQEQIKGVMGSDLHNTLDRLEEIFGTLHPYALEWYAYIPEKDGIFIDDAGIARIQIRIPAYNFDIIPIDEEEEEEVDEFGENEIVLTNAAWRQEYSSMYTGLVLYRYEHAMAQHSDNLMIEFENSSGVKKLLRFQSISDNLKGFKEELERLLDKNGYAFGYMKMWPYYWFHDLVEEVKITIGSGDEEETEDVEADTGDEPEETTEAEPKEQKTVKNPMEIKKIEIKLPNCPYQTLGKKSGTGYKTFKKQTYDATLYNLLAKKDTAVMAMQAIEPKSVTDFAKEFIYPKVTMNMSWDLEQKTTDTVAGCIAESALDIIDWGELIDDLILGTLDVFQDELNKKKCADDSEPDPEARRLLENERAARIDLMYKKELKKAQKAKKKELKAQMKSLEKGDKSRTEYTQLLKQAKEFSDMNEMNYQKDKESTIEWDPMIENFQKNKRKKEFIMTIR